MMNPTNWFAFVGDDDTRVWSSATNSYVPADDPNFVKMKGPECPGKLPDEAELWGVMQASAPGYLPDWLFDGETFSQTAPDVYTKSQLHAFARATFTQRLAAVSVEDRLRALELRAQGKEGPANELFSSVDGAYSALDWVTASIDGDTMTTLDQVNEAFG